MPVQTLRLHILSSFEWVKSSIHTTINPTRVHRLQEIQQQWGSMSSPLTWKRESQCTISKMAWFY